jgi:hypothetical protein
MKLGGLKRVRIDLETRQSRFRARLINGLKFDLVIVVVHICQTQKAEMRLNLVCC